MTMNPDPSIAKQNKKPSLFKRIKWKKILRVFSYKVPVGLVLIILVAGGIYFFLGSTGAKDATTLTPAVDKAVALEIKMLVCNEQVDENSLNPRAEELRLQKRFEEVEKVQDVTVEISRKNCSTSSNKKTTTTAQGNSRD